MFFYQSPIKWRGFEKDWWKEGEGFDFEDEHGFGKGLKPGRVKGTRPRLPKGAGGDNEK